MQREFCAVIKDVNKKVEAASVIERDSDRPWLAERQDLEFEP